MPKTVAWIVTKLNGQVDSKGIPDELDEFESTWVTGAVESRVTKNPMSQAALADPPVSDLAVAWSIIRPPSWRFSSCVSAKLVNKDPPLTTRTRELPQRCDVISLTSDAPS